jgi:hypothetical protein
MNSGVLEDVYMKEISKAEGHARQNIFTQNINYAFKGSA